MDKQTITTLQADKQKLRSSIREIRRGMSQEEKICADNVIARAVCTLPEISAASVVSLYVSLPDEVSTDAIRSFLLGQGKTIVVPKVEKGNLEFYRITGDSDLEAGVFGLLEPKTTCPVADTKDVDVFLIPGLAFDRNGNRLGWGKGYYDRALASVKAIKIGLAYDCQIVPVVPVMQSDRAMDRIVTESEVIRVSP